MECSCIVIVVWTSDDEEQPTFLEVGNDLGEIAVDGMSLSRGIPYPSGS